MADTQLKKPNSCLPLSEIKRNESLYGQPNSQKNSEVAMQSESRCKKGFVRALVDDAGEALAAASCPSASL
jgi:hypothetical protein